MKNLLLLGALGCVVGATFCAISGQKSATAGFSIAGVVLASPTIFSKESRKLQ